MAGSNDDIKDILLQLLQEREQWGRPVVSPAQSPLQTVGSYVTPPPPVAASVTMPPQAPNLDPLLLQQQAIQQQQALSMRLFQQQQASVSAFAQGIPGYAAPSFTMSDPTFANYQLQNMYMMNPYMANVFGQAQGGSAMNLAPASYMTPSRFGVFRQGSYADPSQAFGAPSFLRDVRTLGYIPTPFGDIKYGKVFGNLFDRQYAAYEDITDQKIAAGRRMFQRGESTVATGLSWGLTGASLFTGNPVLMAGAMAADVAIGVGTNAYFQRRAEANRIQELSQEISTNYRSGGLRGTGYSFADSSQIMREFRRSAAANPMYNMGDYMQVFEESTKAGLLSFNSSPDHMVKKVKDLIKDIDVFMRLTGDPDVKSAIERMGQLQTLGIASGQMQSAASNLKAFAKMAGTSVDNLMSTSGAYGAQMAVQMGGPGAFGLAVGAMAPGIVKGLQQTGALNELQLSMLGGVEGAGQTLSQIVLNSITSDVGTGLAAFVKFENGVPKIDQEALRSYTRGGKVPGGFNTLQDAAASSFSKMSQNNRQQVITYQHELAGEALMQLRDPVDMMNFERQRIAGYKRIFPEYNSKEKEPQLLMMMYGDRWRLMQGFLSEDNEKTILTQQNEAQRTVNASREETFKQQQSLINQVTTAVTSGFNNVMDLLPFDRIAAAEQARAAQAAGLPYVSGMGGSGLKGDAISRLAPLGKASPASRAAMIEHLRHARAGGDDVLEMYEGGFFKSAFRAFSGLWDPKERKGRNQLYNEMFDAASGYQDLYENMDKLARDSKLTPAEIEAASSKIFNGSRIDFESLFKMQRPDAAKVLQYLNDSGSNSDFKKYQIEWHKVINSIEPIRAEAMLNTVSKEFSEERKKFDLDKGSETGAFYGLIDAVANVPGMREAGREQVLSVASTLAAKGATLNRQALAQVFKGSGVALSDEAAASVERAGMEFRGSLDSASKEAFSSATPTSVMGLTEKALDYAAVEKAAQESLTKGIMPGVFSSQDEREMYKNRSEILLRKQYQAQGLDYDKLMEAGGDKAAEIMKLKDQVASQMDIGNKALGLDLHTGSAENYERGQFNLQTRMVALLEEIAKKSA